MLATVKNYHSKHSSMIPEVTETGEKKGPCKSSAGHCFRYACRNRDFYRRQQQPKKNNEFAESISESHRWVYHTTTYIHANGNFSREGRGAIRLGCQK